MVNPKSKNINKLKTFFSKKVLITIIIVAVIIAIVIVVLYFTVFKKNDSNGGNIGPTTTTTPTTTKPSTPLPSTEDFVKFINPILSLNGISNPQNDLLFNSQQYNWDSFTTAVDYWNSWANNNKDPYRPTYCTFLSTTSCMDSISGNPGCNSELETLTPNQVLQEMCAIFANAMVETDGFKACKEYLGCTSGLSDIEGITWTVGGQKYTTNNYPDPLQGTCSQKIGDKVQCNQWTSNYGGGSPSDPNTKTSKSCGGNICLYLNPPIPNQPPGTWTSCGGVHGEMIGAQYDSSGNAQCKNKGGPTQISCPEPPVECSDFMGNLAQRDPSKSLEIQKAGMSKVGCFYGRGLAQLTTPCNYGAMSYYTQGMPYMQQLGKSFCSHPDSLCQDQIAGWLGNIWYWVALVKKGWIYNKRCFGTSTANYHPSGGPGAHENKNVSPPVSPGTRAQWYAWLLLFKFPKAADGNGWDLRLGTGAQQVTKDNFSTINWTQAGDFLYVADGTPPTSCGDTNISGCVSLGGGHQDGFCCKKGTDCSQINDPAWVKDNCQLGYCSTSPSNCQSCDKTYCPNNTQVKSNMYSATK